MSKSVCVTGAGGMIGGHLVKRLLGEGYQVRAIDNKPWVEWHQRFDEARNLQADLRDYSNCAHAIGSSSEVYNLACDMGGIGHIESHKTDCMLSVLISANMLRAAGNLGVKRFFYSSSACIYPLQIQDDPGATALKESDAYPANSEDGYGWEKLFSERLGNHFMEDGRMEFRVARYHNVYGTHTTYDGGREKAPAAICRKVALAKITGDKTIDIWGDGNQTRSFMEMEDCIEGTRRIMDSDIRYPINLGSSELVTINELVSMVEEIAGITLERQYLLDAPQGVRGRNSDNTLIKQELDWEPSIPLKEGLKDTYEWIYNKLK